jgi:putative component of membrane protein insertase Oxa1/YidC/SpoIIIJ protein YidD
MKNIMEIPKNLKYAFIILSLSIACSLTCHSQVPSDTSLLKTLFNPEVPTKEYSIYIKNSESELKVLFSLYYLFYKEFISSQDVDACVFYPSCSAFTMNAIEKKGIMLGLLEGFDRLQRCHAFVNKNDYPYNTIIMKYHDPD